MKKSIFLLMMLIGIGMLNLNAQEVKRSKIEILKAQKEKVVSHEKEALKKEVLNINNRLEKAEITEAEAKILKRKAAKNRALNIANKTAIIDNHIALLERNENYTLSWEKDSLSNSNIEIGFGSKDKKNYYLSGIKIEDNRPRKPKYDIRTHSNLVVAFGLNNAIFENQSIDDSPYKIGGSRFFEIGWNWQTRVFKNTNFLRINYGMSLQFNGLKPTNNNYFVEDGNHTVLQEFDYDLKKSKLRMDNLVMPIHFEIGQSRVRQTEHIIRYHTYKKFKLGFGGYAGFNINTVQKLKYRKDNKRIKDKIRKGYNTNNFVYGLSGYIGFGDALLYAKYDLNPIFKNAQENQNNISVGLRLHL
ncbi:MAG: hypothetical protein CSA39_07240 [Flavobacteriales bacterium]|nr:MAG: hypothetical protein CSA39_07240 [Flavobacteriales bacterium]